MREFTKANPRTQPILIVEDSPEDYEAIARAFEKAHIANRIFHCEEGDEALDFLFHRGEFASRDDYPRPGIILLDLNLPGTDGREVLQEIKESPALKTIPVLVLTTSTDERDIETCYQAGANSYIQKPVDVRGFMSAVGRLKEYWLELVILPRPPIMDR